MLAMHKLSSMEFKTNEIKRRKNNHQRIYMYNMYAEMNAECVSMCEKSMSHFVCLSVLLYVPEHIFNAETSIIGVE